MPITGGTDRGRTNIESRRRSDDKHYGNYTIQSKTPPPFLVHFLTFKLFNIKGASTTSYLDNHYSSKHSPSSISLRRRSFHTPAVASFYRISIAATQMWLEKYQSVPLSIKIRESTYHIYLLALRAEIVTFGGELLLPRVLCAT